jgi:hypothetical protein
MTQQIESPPCCHALDYGQLIEAEISNRYGVRADPDYSSCAIEG